MSTKSDLELSLRNLNCLYSITVVHAENEISLLPNFYGVIFWFEMHDGLQFWRTEVWNFQEMGNTSFFFFFLYR